LASRLDKGFVEEEDLGVSNNGATQRNALALSTGKRLRFSLEHLFETKRLGCTADGFRDEIIVFFAILKPKAMFSKVFMCG
jgi:hypothetical protein